jgi:hypothetical protein
MKSFKPVGGSHPETATLRSALAHQQILAPHTGKPWSEPMLLGLGGGLGVGYILWEFKKHASASLVLGFQYKWNYPVQFMTSACRRAGALITVRETAGSARAAAQMDAALAENTPAITWVHEGGLAYRRVIRGFDDCWGWMLNVYGRSPDGKEFFVEDLGKRPFTVPSDELTLARGKIPSYRNRLMFVRPGKLQDPAKAILGGVRDCVKYLTSGSDTFGLPAIRKWARLMTDTNNPKGWPKVFKSRRGLFSTLRGIYEGIKHKGSEGAALRFMYSDFLKEAEAPCARPELREAARYFRRAGNQWIRLANAAFPADQSPFREVRNLLDRKYRLLKSGGVSAQAELEKIGGLLASAYDRGDREFPMTAPAVDDLFLRLQASLEDLHAIESEAIGALAEAAR